VEVADLGKDGRWRFRFSEHPRRYFVDDATRHVHIQIMKVPPLPPFPEANTIEDKLPSAEHALARLYLILRYLHVDEKKHVVTHLLQQSDAMQISAS